MLSHMENDMNDDTVAGKFDQVAGKIKEKVGEAVGNERLSNSGTADQVKGNAKETWANVKDITSDVHDDARVRSTSTSTALHEDTSNTGHDVRNSVTSTAQNVKNSINDKLDNLKDDHNR